MMLHTALDFCIETWTASPTATDLTSQLAAMIPGTTYCVVMWNDEKHTYDAVIEQLGRALPRSTPGEALDAALRVNSTGREVVLVSATPILISHVARTIANIDLAVTVRPAQATFNELVSGIMLDFLNDLAGLSIGTQETHNPYFLTLLAEALDGPANTSRFCKLLLADVRLWKAARLGIRELVVRVFSLGGSSRQSLGSLS